VRFGATSTRVTGTLGGRRFDVSLARVELARTGSREWPSRAVISALLERRGAHALGGRTLFSWLP
jgi:hypothetical protein